MPRCRTSLAIESPLRNLLRPPIVVPLVLGLALIGALLGVSDIHQVGAAIGRLQGGHVLAFFALMLVYETIRGVQWHVLLRGLRVRVPLDAEAFSFLMGEASKSAPIGNYFQNYLLAQVEDKDFGRTSATTTLVVLTEVAWSLAGIVIIGIDGWTTWLRPLILIGLTVFACLATVVYRASRHANAPRWITSHAATRAMLEEFARFRGGIAMLVRPRVLVVEAALSAIYLLAAAAALNVAAMGLGITSLSFPQILAVYLLSLAAGLIIPLPIDLGVVEVSGVGALVASGVGRDVAVGLMLVNRLLSIGSAVVIATISLLFLRAELQRALSNRSPGGARDDQLTS